METILDFIAGSWRVTGQMAPYLLLGFLAAGVLSVLISAAWIERHLGGRGLSPIIKSALFGVPMPLCSCGVIPVTASLRKHGASRGSTLSFLLSTPQTGVDSILATYALLGPVFAVYRPVAALVMGVLGGLFTSATTRAEDEKPVPEGTSVCQAECCSDEDARRPKWLQALHYGLITLPRDIAWPLIVGILIAGLIGALVEKDYLASYLGGGLGAMLVMMAIGIPLYVCSTASIPIAAGFMHLGASPGAALVFLIAGPATNAAAVTVVWRTLGWRTGLTYLATVAVGSLAAGFALDAIYNHVLGTQFVITDHVHEHGMTWLGHASAIVLGAVMVVSLWPRRTREVDTPVKPEDVAGDTAAEQQVIEVRGMTCSHCANSVGRALREVPGVASADVSLDQGRATIRGAGVDLTRLVEAVKSLGYDARPAGS